jgi:adenylate cyclase
MHASGQDSGEYTLHPMTSGRRVRMALMFTDIVGSTGQLAGMGDERWSDVLGWHDAMLRRRIEEHAGREAKQTGDGFFAVFPHASSALLCALEIQRSVARFAQVNEMPLAVRIGVHMADVLEMSGDYVGRGVHEAARIAQRARGGEVLTSVATLAEAQMSVGASRRRRIVLRGLPDPMKVVAIA